MKIQNTIILVVIALILLVVAIVAVPTSVSPDAFSDQGELLYPDFTDPFVCKELQVFAPNAETSEVKDFSVKYEDGLWRIPSHNGYPADATERMASAAASLIGLKKDMVRSDHLEDQALFGVVDPLDGAASNEGRGKRIVLKNGAGQVIADLIIGKQVDDSSSDMMMGQGRNPADWAYVRKPGSKRIYAVNFRGVSRSGGGGAGGGGELLKDISTNFSEWIDTDLLHMENNSISKITLNNYSVDETSGSVANQELNVLTKNDTDWLMEGLTDDEQVKEETMRDLVSTLDTLTIAGVRPQPERLDPRSLMSKGFFVNQSGALFGNEGQMDVYCEDGVSYHLFFGEVLFGSGDEITAGKKADEKKEGAEAKKSEGADSVPTENRYLFIRVTLDEDFDKEAKAQIASAKAEIVKAEEEINKKATEEGDKGEDKSGEEENKAAKEVAADKPDWEAKKKEGEAKKKEWEDKLDKAAERIKELNLGFGSWYYVITGESFSKLRLDRSELVELKVPDTSTIGEQPEAEGVTTPIKNPSGLSYIDLRTGSGRAAAKGDTIKVIYTGWLKDGTEFDKSEDLEIPFSFKLGEGEVIKGWDEGIVGMTKGGKRKLIIPPDLGYGAEGSGEKIPPNSYLIFDVELIDASSDK